LPSQAASTALLIAALPARAAAPFAVGGPDPSAFRVTTFASNLPYYTTGFLRLPDGSYLVAANDAGAGAGFDTSSGKRLRLTDGVHGVGSWPPRASGFRPGVSTKTVGIEKRLRGHVFQLNFSNSLGTTMAEMARGASNDSDWFLGFNISRKFF
jgi:hypothetical protein